jgi:ABC-type multidrug transport system fused ATPase/permease subunit
MFMAFTINVRMALIFLVTIVLLFLVVGLIMSWSVPRYGQIQGGLDLLLGLTRENHTGVRVIRAFGLEEKEKDNFNDKNEKLMKLQTVVGSGSALMNPVTYLILNLAVALLIYRGSIHVDMGDLTQGQVVALYNYMSQILVELIKLANLILLLTRALTSAARLQDIMAMEPDERAYEAQSDLSGVRSASVDNSRQADDIILEAHDLSFTYPGSAESALDGISFEVKAGETLGIIGGTGSGKSTLTKLITHRYDISGGSLKILGRDSSSYTDEEMPRICGVVPQKAQLFAGTLSDNLRAAGPDASEDEMWEALRVAQAYDFVKEKGQGLELPVLREGKNFSGGQKQRLTIARALLTKAPIIILDDSASALDMLTEKNLREALGELEWKPSLVIVSQRASSVLSAEHILVLEGGEVAGYGTAKELLESSNVFREIYDTQFGDLQGEEVVT